MTACGVSRLPPAPDRPAPTVSAEPSDVQQPVVPASRSEPTITAVSTVESGRVDDRGTVTWLVRASPAENKGQETVFEPLLQKQLPNLRLNRVVVPAERYVPTINSLAAAGTSLEIWGFGGNYADYWVRHLPQSLDGYIAGDKWDLSSYFLPGLADIYNLRGHQYGLPQLAGYGSNVVYNKNLFDAAGLKYPPLDWDDRSWSADALVADAAMLTKGYGRPEGTYGISVTLWDRMTSLAYLWGGDSWLPEHYARFIAPKSRFGDDANVQAHQWRHDLIYQHKVHPDPATEHLLGQFADPFRTGRIAMVLDGGWQFWTTANIHEFRVGVAPIPWFKANKVLTFDDFWIMGRWSTKKDAAWAALRVLTSVEATTDYARLSRTPPAPRQSTQAWAKDRAEFLGLSLEQLLRMLSQSIDKRAQESPEHLFLEHPRIDDTYNNQIGALWNDPTATAAGVIPAVARAIDRTVLDVYDQYKNQLPQE
jgi:multiple sugar transport system substrate-binding protein